MAENQQAKAAEKSQDMQEMIDIFTDLTPDYRRMVLNLAKAAKHCVAIGLKTESQLLASVKKNILKKVDKPATDN